MCMYDEHEFVSPPPLKKIGCVVFLYCNTFHEWIIMRLPSLLRVSSPAPLRLRVPMKQLHGKMGQVQDDQSRTSGSSDDGGDDAFFSTTNTTSAAVVPSEAMGVKHATDLEKSTGNLIIMDSTTKMGASFSSWNNSENYAQSEEIMSGDDDDDECGSRLIPHVKCENSPQNSCSQMNSEYVRKRKRRTWWSNGRVSTYTSLCLLFWISTSSSFNHCVDAITTNTNSGERPDSGPSIQLDAINGDLLHKLSEHSAIVKIEPEYQPIIFPKTDSSHLQDNHLHSQLSSNGQEVDTSKSNPTLADFPRDGDSNFEETRNAPSSLDIPESSRSTIIYRGIRNRTRVEVGPVSLFATKRRGGSEEESLQTHRRGRVMFPKSEALNEREDNATISGSPSSSSRTTKSEALLASALGKSSEEGSSRKASPDVQDIIDGIVKLLGGKVHHPQPVVPPQVPFTQRQPQSTAYNLFNPTKPLFYQTQKPSRINSRGPPLGGPQNGNNPQQQQQQPQSQSSFEAIPLEALNSEFKLNQTRFGPPFPLSQVVVSPEAPYKQGVPVPEQLVPPPNSINNNNHGNFNLRPQLPTPTAPSSYATDGNGNANTLNSNENNRQNNGFFANGNNRYNNNNGNSFASSQRPGSSPPSSPASNHNGSGGLTTVSTTVTTSHKTTPHRHHHHHTHSQDNANENGTHNLYNTSPNLYDGNTRKPTTSIISSAEGSGSGTNSNTALTTITTQLSETEDKTTLSNNYGLSSPRPPPLSLTLPTGPEDDEEDDLRFTTNVDFDLGGPNIKWNESPAPNILGNRKAQEPSPPINLEPTITDDDSQLPTWSGGNSGRVGSNKETVIEFSELTPSRNGNSFIRPTSANTLYPTLVLETNSENGLVEIVTKLAAPNNQNDHHGQQQIVPSTSTQHQYLPAATLPSAPTPHPESNLKKQVQHFNSLQATKQTTVSGTLADSEIGTKSIHSLPTPPLRPGIVINDGPPAAGSDGKGYGSVEVVTVDDKSMNGGKVGEIFDVTVTAKQSFGGKVTGQPFVVPDVKDDLVITQPTGTEQYVSIDGKRTYFSLHPNTPTAIGSGGATKAVGQVLPVPNTDVVSIEIGKHPGNKIPTPAKPQSSQNIGVGSVGNPVPLLPQPPGKTLFGMHSGSASAPGRAVSTSLSISGSSGGMTGPSGTGKSPPNLIRRPLPRRPSIPPVRIDTCIVGDDATCNSEQGEVCKTESGVSSCVCRSGYARRRHREPCKAIVSLVLSIKLDKLGDKKLSYNPDYFNPNSELYQTIEWETIHAMDSAMGETTLSSGYVGSKLEAIGFDGRHAVVNTTVLIQESLKQSPSQVKRDLQKQMIQVLTRNRNNFGKSQLWVEGPISAVSAITDLDECESPEMNDCDSKARCVNTLGSFECKCESGYGDPFEKDKRRSGRKCESCNGKTYCNGRGDCLVENGQKVCRCAGNYYGSQCDIDGEVLAVAIGASVSAVVIIGLTLACLCMWSRKWKREEQKAALMSRTLFGGMATQALSYLGKNQSNPYQQHLSMDDRLRWAQVNDPTMGGNIYVQNEPMSMHTSPQMIGSSMMETPPLMSARRSAETVDTTVDDLYDDRQTKQRPRSRASQIQGSLYYDLEPEPKSDIYASRSMVQFPAQFCVPMAQMSHYAPPNRGYYP